jgi:hypothetical protein
MSTVVVSDSQLPFGKPDLPDSKQVGHQSSRDFVQTPELPCERVPGEVATILVMVAVTSEQPFIFPKMVCTILDCDLISVAVTGAVTAELPWAFLEMVCSCAAAECKALLQGGASAARLTPLLHKALEHAAGMLHQTATDEIYVSRPTLPQHVSSALH